MVVNGLSREEVEEKAGELNFPSSVIDYLQGNLGTPYGGFPEPFRTRALKGQVPAPAGRPGAALSPFDFESVRATLEHKYGTITDDDLASYSQYPAGEEQAVAHTQMLTIAVLGQCLPSTEKSSKPGAV